MWRFATLWRLAFAEAEWQYRRRGDGALLGDRPDGLGGFGYLSNHITKATWGVSLGWVRRRCADGLVGEPSEFADQLGLFLVNRVDLWTIPLSASLELKFSALEAGLDAVLADERQRQPSPSEPIRLEVRHGPLDPLPPKGEPSPLDTAPSVPQQPLMPDANTPPADPTPPEDTNPLPDVLRTLEAEVLHHKERLPEPDFLRVASRLLGVSKAEAAKWWQGMAPAARRAAHGQSPADKAAAKAGIARLDALLRKPKD
jgi:hypothetical protein